MVFAIEAAVPWFCALSCMHAGILSPPQSLFREFIDRCEANDFDTDPRVYDRMRYQQQHRSRVGACRLCTAALSDDADTMYMTNTHARALFVYVRVSIEILTTPSRLQRSSMHAGRSASSMSGTGSARPRRTCACRQTTPSCTRLHARPWHASCSTTCGCRSPPARRTTRSSTLGRTRWEREHGGCVVRYNGVDRIYV